MKCATCSWSDQMDQRLLEAARLGDVAALEKLLGEDPLILQKVSLSSVIETPLHVASIAGRIDFVKQILLLMPSFARQLNKDGFSPLHMAAAQGYLEIVVELLLRVGPELCMLKDKRGRTSLHYAVTNGRVQIIDKLLSNCPQAVAQVTIFGETPFHLAVKNSQFEAFKVMFETSEKLDDHEMRVNAKDNEGNTVFEMAKARDQLQVLDFLKQKSHRYQQEIIVEDTHGDDNTQVDETRRKDEYKQILKNAWSQYLQDKDLVPVIATVMAAATFQAGLNPPSIIWEKGIHLDNKCIGTALKSEIGLMSCPALRFYMFMVTDTLAFASSLILVPFRQHVLFAPILTMISLLFALVAYFTFLCSISPNNSFTVFFSIVIILTFTLPFLKPIVASLSLLLKCFRKFRIGGLRY